MNNKHLGYHHTQYMNNLSSEDINAMKDSVTLWGRLNTEQTDEKRSNMIIHCRPRLPCQLYAVLYWTDGHKVNIILTITMKNAIAGVWGHF